MTFVSNRDITAMSDEALQARLSELREEMLQLNAEKALGGTPASMGAYKATRRSIARIKTHMAQRAA